MKSDPTVSARISFAVGRVSMREVAAQAGVSRSAVSLALQQHPSIPAATRARIESAAAQLGYRKNPLVAALMRSRRAPATIVPAQASLAFFTADRPNDAWRDIDTVRQLHSAASARAAQRGFRLDEFSLTKTDMRPRRLADLLKARGVHGVLVAPLPGDQSSIDFDFTDFAVVGLGPSVQNPAIDRVADDHYRSAQIAFENALALGYRRIGLALPAYASRRMGHRWWSGFLVAQQSLPQSRRLPALMPETRDELPSLLNAWIARHRLDAVIFSIRDPELLGHAPREIGLISLAVADSGGAIAGIRQNTDLIGIDAVDLLVEKAQRWETGALRSPRFQLVAGAWNGGLSAPGAGRPRQALLATS